MKKSIYFRQEKPLTIWVLGTLMLFLSVWFAAIMAGPLHQIILMGTISLLLLGYSVSYEFTQEYNNKRHYSLFGYSLFSTKLNLLLPDYITVFSAKFKQGSDWGPIGALGKGRSGGRYVLRLFKGNRHFTVFKTNSFRLANERAVRLSELIKVEFLKK